MSEDFDPYYAWLAIPPEEQPPNAYRLLGLRVFESDVDVISTAADRQIAYVRTQCAGPHAQHASRLLSELTAARTLLLENQCRAILDENLRRQSAIAPGGTGKTHRKSTTDVAPHDEASDSEFTLNPASGRSTSNQFTSLAGKMSRGSRRNHQSRVVVMGHVIASVVGLSLGYLVLCWAHPQFDILDLFHSAPLAESSTEQDGQSSPEHRRSPGDAGLKIPRRNSASARQAGTKSQQSSRGGTDVVQHSHPLGDPNEQPTSVRHQPDILASIPAFVNLPTVHANETAQLFPINVPADKPWSLELVSGPLPHKDGRRFRLLERTLDSSGRPAWPVVLGPISDETSDKQVPRPGEFEMARLTRLPDALEFQWNTSMDLESAGQLSNAVLRISVDNSQRTIALRRPQMVPPMTLDLSNKVRVRTFPVVDLPPLEHVHFRITRLESFPLSHIMVPTDPVVQFGETILIKPASIESAQLRIKTHVKAGTPAISVDGVFRLPGSKHEYELTSDSINKQQSAFNTQLTEARREMAKLRQLAKTLPSQLENARKIRIQAGRTAVALAFEKSQTINAIQTEIMKNKNLIEKLARQIPELEQKLATLGPISQLFGTTDGPSRLHFRVFLNLDGHEVDFLASGNTTGRLDTTFSDRD